MRVVWVQILNTRKSLHDGLEVAPANRRVADLLEKRGHKVFAPTLTGLGERSHLMSAMITLDTHLMSLVNRELIDPDEALEKSQDQNTMREKLTTMGFKLREL